MSDESKALPYVSLYYKDEKEESKETHIRVVGDEEHGYKVEYGNGKKGKVKMKFKNPSPVQLEHAMILYDQVVKEFQKKGLI
jgi:hypothetical protein